MQPCSCGCFEPHVIARRETADGRRVKVWSDGMVTHADPFGTHICGIGRARSDHNANGYARAGRAIVDIISLFDFSELRTLVRVARDRAWHNYKSEDMRRQHITAIVGRKTARGLTGGQRALDAALAKATPPVPWMLRWQSRTK